MPKTPRLRRATDTARGPWTGSYDDAPVSLENMETVLRFSESDIDHWIERLATEPGSTWVATWHDPDGRFRRSRVRSMQCQATGKNGLQCKRSVSIGAPLCTAHTRSVFGLEVRPSGIDGAGNGLFTTRAREAGALLCPYPGRWFRAKDLHPDWAADYAYTTADGVWVIDALGLRGIGSLANTALTRRPDASGNLVSDPEACNATITDVWDPDHRFYKVVVQATRPLRRGEEILVNYGTLVTFPADHMGVGTDPAVGPVVATRRIKRPKIRRALLTF